MIERASLRQRFVATVALLLVVLAAAGARPKPKDEERVTVFAAASLSESFAAIAAAFEKRSGHVVRFNLGGSQQLAVQIEHGARADLFASADERWISYVGERELLDGAPVVFARNRLAVIVPVANPARIDRLEHLARPGVKLLLGADAVPVGRYARQSIQKLAGAPGFGADYPRRVLANVVSEEENVKAIVSKVQLGEADAGIVYRSDVTRTVVRRVRVLEIPDGYNVMATYPIAVVRAAPHPEAARAFVEFLRSPEGQRILERHGLLRAPATP